MKVKDLVKNTEWYPGRDYLLQDGKLPTVSVLLPTFRRANSGLFRRAVQSVLDQSLYNLELIIVDDASTDGTAEQIAEFMDRDGRVSCLRHPFNIGLPAISEYEGFLKARGEYIAFQFDDDFFYPEAFEQLLEHSRKNVEKVCYGSVTMHVREPNSETEYKIDLGQELSLYNLRSGNVVPNNGVLLHRKVIEKVGFYDPHVVMSRQCDWDLWRRIGEFYELMYVGVCVGEVGGPATTDSLGKTYAIDSWASEEWMAQDRNARLTPEAFKEYDVFATPPEISCYTKQIISEMTVKHALPRKLYKIPETYNQESRHKLSGNILVLSSVHTASVTLCFDYLPQIPNTNIRVITVPGGFDLPELARASCVVIVREFYPYKLWIEAANLLGVPVYYYLDDNFVELSNSGTVSFQEDFSLDGLRERLRAFAGVLLTSQGLVDYFKKHLIHCNSLYFPPCYTGSSLMKVGKTEEVVTVAFAGGGHRQEGLINHILPALKCVVDNGVNLHLVLGGINEEQAAGLKKRQVHGLKITTLKFELDWKRVLLKIASHAPDILIHAPSDNPNNCYKTLNVAISANLIDALLIVPAQPPYDLQEFSECAIQVDSPFEAASWLDVISKLLENRKSWEEIKHNNARFCETYFSGEKNVSVLRKMLEVSPMVGVLDVENRLRTLYSNKRSDSIHSPNVVSEKESLKVSLLELSRIRKSTRTRRFFNIFRRKYDMWETLSPSFKGLRQYVLQENSRKLGMFLELSDSLHDKSYVEYPIVLKKGRLENFLFALASEGVHDGLLGIEIVSSTQEILSHVVLPLSSINLNLPVIFPLNGLMIEQGNYFVRLFVKTGWPIYLVEFAKYRFGFDRKTLMPFCQPVYSEG
jgi:glycosyltransferase involved in cell wall biosynthesis